jgi:hypothetical protein
LCSAHDVQTTNKNTSQLLRCLKHIWGNRRHQCQAPTNRGRRRASTTSAADSTASAASAADNTASAADSTDSRRGCGGIKKGSTHRQNSRTAPECNSYTKPNKMDMETSSHPLVKQTRATPIYLGWQQAGRAARARGGLGQPHHWELLGLWHHEEPHTDSAPRKHPAPPSQHPKQHHTYRSTIQYMIHTFGGGACGRCGLCGAIGGRDTCSRTQRCLQHSRDRIVTHFPGLVHLALTSGNNNAVLKSTQLKTSPRVVGGGHVDTHRCLVDVGPMRQELAHNVQVALFTCGEKGRGAVLFMPHSHRPDVTSGNNNAVLKSTQLKTSPRVVGGGHVDTHRCLVGVGPVRQELAHNVQVAVFTCGEQGCGAALLMPHSHRPDKTTTAIEFSISSPPPPTHTRTDTDMEQPAEGNQTRKRNYKARTSGWLTSATRLSNRRTFFNLPRRQARIKRRKSAAPCAAATTEAQYHNDDPNGRRIATPRSPTYRSRGA